MSYILYVSLFLFFKHYILTGTYRYQQSEIVYYITTYFDSFLESQ